RAAMATAQRNALEILKGATLESGARVGTLLQDDSALRMRVEGKLRGVRPVKTHYFSDGGVSLEIEVPLAMLPPEIADHLKPPAGTPAAAGALPQPPPAGPSGPAPQVQGDVLVVEAMGPSAVLAGDRPAARET